MKIKDLPLSERPYEKLELYGAEKLSNAELLAIIIKTGTKEKTVITIAQEILKLQNGNNLRFLQDLSIEDFMKIKGIGKVKAIQLKAVGELAIRMFKTSNYKKSVIKEPHDLAKILMSELKFEKSEKVKLVILNNRNEILKISEIASGGTNFANVSIKDILSEPIKMKAPKIILVHNHPSGDSTPSKQDIMFTEQLYEITELVGIQLVDHLVIGNMNYTSIFSEISK